MTRLKVMSANFYVGNKQPVKDAKFVASLNPDIVGIQEGHSGNAVAIRETNRPEYRTWWRKSKNNDKQLAFMDVPVSYKRKLQVTREWARLISKRAQKENIGMPRAATAVRFEKDDVWFTFINTHTNAAVQKDGIPFPTRIKRVAEFIKGMVILEAMIRTAQARGDHVILVGDLNFRVVKIRAWEFSPQAVFRRTGLKFQAKGIDYIAYSRKLKASNFQVIDKRRTGADHDWLTLELDAH